MRAVCSFVTIVLVLLELSLKGFTLQNINNVRDLREFQNSFEPENPFVDVNICILSAEQEAWQNGGYVTDMTYNDVELTVKILLNQFGCADGIGENMSELCNQCAMNITDHVFALVSHDDVLITESEFEDATMTLFYLFSLNNIQSTCNMSLWFTSLENYQHALLNTDGTENVLTEEELDIILEQMNQNYSPETLAKCFDVESLFSLTVDDHEAGATRNEMNKLSSFSISYLVQGFCIGSPTIVDPYAFVEDVFDQYGSQGIVSEDGFGEMLTALGVGGSPQQHIHAHTKRSAQHEGKTGRFVRAADHHHPNISEIENVTVTCFNGEELWDIYGIEHEIGMNEIEFQDLCPSLIQQLLRQSCNTEATTNSQDLSAKVWIYSSLSVFIISIASILGGLLFPFLPSKFYEKFINSLISLAVAVLVGDAIIHLLPLATGLHGHEEGVVHSPLDPELAYLWKSLAAVIAVYFFYLFETLIGSFSGHDHSHRSSDHLTMTRKTDQENGGISKSFSQTALTDYVDSYPEVDIARKQNFLTRYGPVPVMIIMGDALHNMGDGLAIGAAFSAGLGPGISTSLAVLCHEIPHELGDLGLLLKLGVKLKWALCLNYLSSISAFVGLYIGILLAQTEEARQWIFAITAGMFLYVALADMVPQISNIKEVKDPWLTFLLQNVFFLFGLAFIFVMALYEDAIAVSL